MKHALIAGAALALSLPIAAAYAGAAGSISSVRTAPTMGTSGGVLGTIADCDSAERLPEYVRKRGNPVLDDAAAEDAGGCPQDD